MTLGKNISTTAHSFKSSESGNVALMTALLMPVVFGVAGVALDFSRMSNVQTQANNALDAAVLFVGSDLVDGRATGANIQKEINDAFVANYTAIDGTMPSYQIKSATYNKATGEINASVQTTLEASFLKVVGKSNLEVLSESTAIFQQSDVEVAMMLDVTGSMNSRNKIGSLRAAAGSAVDILLSGSGKDSTRIALVPYSNAVRLDKNLARKATLGNQLVAGGGNLVPGPVSVDGCVTERIGANAATDVDHRTSRVSSDIRARGCRSAKVVPLTNKKNKLKNRINGLRASSVTAGHVGITWTYYALSGNWDKFWGAQAAPAAYSKDVQKVAILMSDGIFNTAYSKTAGTNLPQKDNNGPRTAESNSSALKLCADMKALKAGEPGIKIYSVAFDAPTIAQKLLRDCANADTETDTFYYSARNGKELKVAFEAIANSIKKLRLSQ